MYFHSEEEGGVRLVTRPRPTDQHKCIEVGPGCGGVDTDAGECALGLVFTDPDCVTKNKITRLQARRKPRLAAGGRAVGALVVFAFLRGNTPAGNLIRVNTGGVWLIRPGASARRFSH